MADTTIRWACVTEIVSGLGGMPMMSGAQVDPGWPGDEAKPELVWVSDLDGEVTIPVSKAGRMYRDDQFQIPLQVRVFGKRTTTLTGDRLHEIVSAIEDYFADDCTIGDFDGVVSAEVSSVRSTITTLPEGPIGFAEVVVSVHARLT